MPRWYFEDFTPGLVLEGKGSTVTEKDIVTFATQFDPQYFHLDDEAAKSSLFGKLCASGWHTAAMCMRMMCDAYLLDSASLGSPGIDQLRWVKPVFVDDTLHFKMTVEQQKPSQSKPHMGSVLAKWEVFNQNDELVMHMTGWSMFRKRNP
ncbi:MAG: MaoC family dehydratase [Archangium sp.]